MGSRHGWHALVIRLNCSWIYLDDTISRTNDRFSSTVSSHSAVALLVDEISGMEKGMWPLWAIVGL